MPTYAGNTKTWAEGWGYEKGKEEDIKNAKKLIGVEYREAKDAYFKGAPVYLTSKEQPLPEAWVPLLHTILPSYTDHTFDEKIQAFVSTKITSGRKGEVLYWIDDPEQHE